MHITWHKNGRLKRSKNTYRNQGQNHLKIWSFGTGFSFSDINFCLYFFFWNRILFFGTTFSFCHAKRCDKHFYLPTHLKRYIDILCDKMGKEVAPKEELEFWGGVFKKNSSVISMGLGFWPAWNFHPSGVTQLFRISSGKNIFALEYQRVI